MSGGWCLAVYLAFLVAVLVLIVRLAPREPDDLDAGQE